MPTSARILLCDHGGQLAPAVVPLLEAQGLRVEVSEYLRHSLECLEQEQVDLLIAAPLNQRGLIELETLDQARRSAPATPLLVTIAGREADVDGRIPLGLPSSALGTSLENGPWDVIRRDAPLEEWRLRIDRLLAEKSRDGKLLELEHRATHDDLTGLLRKNAFGERLSEHFSAAHRHRFELALVLIDLDHFGQVNKQFNHVVGDELIQNVGAGIRASLRTEDVAGRLGGDEFAVLLPYTGRADAVAVVGRLRDAIRHARANSSEGEIPARGSLGFETFNGRDLDTEATLREHAETALRSAKERGGDQGVYFRNMTP